MARLGFILLILVSTLTLTSCGPAKTPMPTAEGVQLTAGWNEVTYTGERQTAGVAFESIKDYWVIVYHYNEATGAWEQILNSTILEPGMTLSINVTQDCIWTLSQYSPTEVTVGERVTIKATVAATTLQE